MLRYHLPFDGKRIIGDNRLRIFHDSLNESETIEVSGCGIDRIPYEEVRTFDSDSSGAAVRRGFVQCPFCRCNEKDFHK